MPEQPRFSHLFLVLAIAIGTVATPARGTEGAIGNALLEPGSVVPLADDADPQLLRFEETRARLIKLRTLVDDLARDAEMAVGDDRLALGSALTDARLSSIEDFQGLVDALVDLEARDVEAAQYRAQLTSDLPRLAPAIMALYEETEEALTTLGAEREEASAEAVVELDTRIRRRELVLDRLLAAGAAQVGMLRQLELPAEAETTWLRERADARARLRASRMHLASLRVADLAETTAAAADPTTLEAAQAAARGALAEQADALGILVDLLEGLDVDTALYKRLLIANTGLVTTDVLDRRVAGSLLRGWAADLRESVIDRAPQTVFQLLLLALLLLVVGAVARGARSIAKRAVEAPHLRLSELLKRMIVSFSTGAVWIVGILVAISQFGVEVGPLLAGLGIAGFIVGFALQDSLANFAAGIMILAYRPYDVGDLIECASGVFGKVSRMNLVSTTILTLDNRTLVVPNGKIWGDIITNVTAQTERRVDLVFGISYQDAIPRAEEVLQAIVKEHPKVLAEPAPVVKVHELADSSVNFVVRPWARREDYWDVHWDITREVKLRFDREGISIPFPQQDVHFYAESNGSALDGGVPTGQVSSAATPAESQDPPEADA